MDVAFVVGSEEVAGDSVSSLDEFGVALSEWWGFVTIVICTQGCESSFLNELSSVPVPKNQWNWLNFISLSSVPVNKI